MEALLALPLAGMVQGAYMAGNAVWLRLATHNRNETSRAFLESRAAALRREVQRQGSADSDVRDAALALEAALDRWDEYNAECKPTNYLRKLCSAGDIQVRLADFSTEFSHLAQGLDLAISRGTGRETRRELQDIRQEHRTGQQVILCILSLVLVAIVFELVLSSHLPGGTSGGAAGPWPPPRLAALCWFLNKLAAAPLLGAAAMVERCEVGAAAAMAASALRLTLAFGILATALRLCTHRNRAGAAATPAAVAAAEDEGMRRGCL